MSAANSKQDLIDLQTPYNVRVAQPTVLPIQPPQAWAEQHEASCYLSFNEFTFVTGATRITSLNEPWFQQLLYMKQSAAKWEGVVTFGYGMTQQAFDQATVDMMLRNTVYMIQNDGSVDAHNGTIDLSGPYNSPPSRLLGGAVATVGHSIIKTSGFAGTGVRRGLTDYFFSVGGSHGTYFAKEGDVVMAISADTRAAAIAGINAALTANMASPVFQDANDALPVTATMSIYLSTFLWTADRAVYVLTNNHLSDGTGVSGHPASCGLMLNEPFFNGEDMYNYAILTLVNDYGWIVTTNYGATTKWETLPQLV